eukprot:6747389-Pyramimonas_sp.AAC.1
MKTVLSRLITGEFNSPVNSGCALVWFYLRGDQSQGSHRVYTCVGTNHRGASGYIPAWGPITGEPSGIYPRVDQSHGSQRVYTCVGTNHRGAS